MGKSGGGNAHQRAIRLANSNTSDPTILSEPAEANPLSKKPSSGDKTAIALFLLAIAFSVILYLLVKTVVVVIGLLVLILLLMIFPIRHFLKSARAQLVGFALTVLFICLLGYQQVSSTRRIPTFGSASQPGGRPQKRFRRKQHFAKSAASEWADLSGS